MKNNSLLWALGAALLGCSLASHAADVNVGDYIALPDGMNLVALYGQYSESDKLKVDPSPTYSDKTSLRSQIGIFRAIHFMDVGGFTIDPQILVPFGKIYDVHQNSDTAVSGATGIADPIVGGTLWLVNQPNAGNYGRYLGITPLVYVPIGQYDKNKAVNLGQNRWRWDLQVGYIEPLWVNQSLELNLGAIVYGDNDDYYGNSKLEQDPTYSLQSNYVFSFSQSTRLAIGYAAYWGGKQKVDGSYSGLKTDYGQGRIEYQQMVTQKIQFSGQLTHDFHRSGGYQQQLGMNFRIAYIF